MNADGMVNVQTRHNAEGKPLLLEINMRPSGVSVIRSTVA
jgi:carbamoylphosphate synthase large subunit